MNRKEEIILGFLGIFYILLLMSYMILLIIQGFKNKEYNEFNTPKIVKERFLYEQFSYEIYNSINSPIILDLKIQEECEENYQPIKFILKLNPIIIINQLCLYYIYLIINFVYQFIKN